MSIQFVINGYFRSGTTLLWKLIRDAAGMPVYYEPLHPKLPKFVWGDNEVDKLHGERLWTDYASLGVEEKLRICRNHPNLNDLNLLSDSNLASYFDVYASLGHDCGLQVNRGHFHLDLISDRYSARLIHVVRNPLDVFASLNRVWVTDASFQDRIKFWGYGQFMPIDSFEINRDYNWIQTWLGKPLAGYELRNRVISFFSRFERFAVVWVLSNFFACQAIDKKDGLLVAYEDITQGDSVTRKRISELLSIEIDFDGVVQTRSSQPTIHHVQKFKSVVEKFGLEKECSYILDRIQDNRKVNYGCLSK